MLRPCTLRPHSRQSRICAFAFHLIVEQLESRLLPGETASLWLLGGRVGDAAPLLMDPDARFTPAAVLRAEFIESARIFRDSSAVAFSEGQVHPIANENDDTDDLEGDLLNALNFFAEASPPAQQAAVHPSGYEPTLSADFALAPVAGSSTTWAKMPGPNIGDAPVASVGTERAILHGAGESLHASPLVIPDLVQPSWSSYAHDPQHTAISDLPAQPLASIHWRTPVDLNPQYNGDLLIHYGSPLVTPSNTVIVPVKIGVNDGFEVEAFDGSSGALKWSATTDYSVPSASWTPSFSPVLTPNNRLYIPGAGGTAYYVDNPDANGATVTGQLAFYGISNYSHGYDSNVKICTPLTSDSAGNIYFGFVVYGATPVNLQSGVARMAPTGNGSWVAASAAAGDSAIAQVVYNCAPALSNDQSNLYIAVSGADGYLLRLDCATLATTGEVSLVDPSSGKGAFLPDNGTASPTVDPDGDVYYGILEDPFPANHDRGWLLHFSGDLTQTKIPGAFGWDDTASVVPAGMVPSYTGSSSYLLMTKYNNYKELGGDGINRLAILDPNAMMTDPVTGAWVMQEVLTIAGVTPDPVLPMVREWCINTAAVDPATDSVMANSEDGTLYRWNLTSNSFTQAVQLTSATGEAYTPTVIGVDGTVYAINNATLFAVGSTPPAVAPPPGQSAAEGSPQSFGLGSFTDMSNGFWTSTIVWGDGTPASSFNPQGIGSLGSQSHTYAEEGNYTVTVTVTDNGDHLSGSGTFQVTVSDPMVAGMAVSVSPTAGSPFIGAVATFADPAGAETNDGTHYSSTIDWGDKTATTTGRIALNGSFFTISGSHTYALAGTYSTIVVINHEGVTTTLGQSVTVSNLGQMFQGSQTKTSGFWNDGNLGQELIRKFTKTAAGQTLGQWLANSFPNLYGGVAGAPSLSTFTNAQVGNFYKGLFTQYNVNHLDAEVMALALYIFATTSSLGMGAGGTTPATQYGLQVNVNGLGAYSYNVGFHGAAFGVPNFTVLNIYQIMLGANDSAVSGAPWGSNTQQRNDGQAVVGVIDGDL